ncbi:MAG: hypothetical protein V4736_11090 [Bdellovibrionota bacterium]
MKLFLFILLFAVQSFAQSQSSSRRPSSALQTSPKYSAPIAFKTYTTKLKNPKDRSFQLGAKVDSYSYEEPGVMKEDGQFTGLAAKYTSQKIRYNSHIEGEGSLLKGKVNYKGSLQDGAGNTVPFSATESQEIRELRGLWIFESEISKTRLVSPFVGLGYRNLVDPREHSFDYRREITYWTMPVGARVNLFNKPRHSSDITGTYDYLLEGNVKTKLSDLDARASDLNQFQQGGYGLRVSWDNRFMFQDTPAFASLYYQTWDMEQTRTAQSELFGTTGTFKEPANKTRVLGFTAGMLF